MNTKKSANRPIQKLEIGVASPKQIRQWAERFLPNGTLVGEVTSWETVNYKTLKPEPNGLFCQKIFGPVVDFTCACGKKTTKADRKTNFFVKGFCPKCGVERTHSRVRRYRLGYIKLKQPVVHPLYASQRPSPLGLCLNWPTKRVQFVMRTSEFCCLPSVFTIFMTYLESRSVFQKFSKNSNLNFKKTKGYYLSKLQFELLSKNVEPSFFSKKFLHKTEHFPENTGSLEKRVFRERHPFSLLLSSPGDFTLPPSRFTFSPNGETRKRFQKNKVFFKPGMTETLSQPLVFPSFLFPSSFFKKKATLFPTLNGHQFLSKKEGSESAISNHQPSVFLQKKDENKAFLKNAFVSKNTFFEKGTPFYQIKRDYLLENEIGPFFPSTSLFFTNGLQRTKKSLEKSKKDFIVIQKRKRKRFILSSFFPKWEENVELTRPRLFAKPQSATQPVLLSNMESVETRFYGIAYDATWRQVEEFQEFLFYLWEQSFSYEFVVPYYIFTKFVEIHNQDTPRYEQSYAIQTGGFALQHILGHLNLSGLQNEIGTCSLQATEGLLLIKQKISVLDFRILEHRKEIKRLRIKLNRLQQLLVKWKRQLEIFRDFEQAKMQPSWMILSYLPVLPPGLRPITSIRGELVVSDINTLYRKVLIRNKRITRGANFGVFDTALSGSWLSWCYNVRQLQEAVDELLKTGSIESGRPLKSLLEGLKGKGGRFRQHLLGKRVDYSGRSVIVVGPELKLHQCGLPKQMAIELFQPFLIQKLRKKGIVFTTTAAKSLIAERKPIVWALLGEILKTHPVLLNRAPTLHRLGIQAFLPQLVEGKAILLHPLVCPAFNADFDGDQMAVHVPLSAKTRAEALNLLWSRNHLLAPASGQPLLLPTQDMVLGFYYLTCSLEKTRKEKFISSSKVFVQNQQCCPKKKIDPFPSLAKKSYFFAQTDFFGTEKKEANSLFNKEKRERPIKSPTRKNVYFSDFFQVKRAYDRGLISLHTPIWVKWSGLVQTFISEQQSRPKETLLETRLDISARRETLFLDNCSIFNTQKIWTKQTQFVRTTSGRIFMHLSIFQSNDSFSQLNFFNS
jgi:DNA-directed RNA polymerase beta' subunit